MQREKRRRAIKSQGMYRHIRDVHLMMIFTTDASALASIIMSANTVTQHKSYHALYLLQTSYIR